jgi:menaquinone-dependent protoporphyrinogen IX oxidase
MNYVIVYWSRYGHNRKIVERLSEKLKENGHTAKLFKADELKPNELPNADMYVFSAAAEAFRIQKHMRTFMKKISDVDGKNVALINTHAMKKKNWLGNMEKMVKKKNMNVVASTDFLIGDGQNKGEGLSSDWETKLDEFADTLHGVYH